jgi:hypothetical protein
VWWVQSHKPSSCSLAHRRLALMQPPHRLREFALADFKEALAFAQSGHRTHKAAFAPAQP